MSFDAIIEKLLARLREPLPGRVAHEPLRATPVGNVLPKFEHKIAPKPGSVLILLYEDEGALKFPLIKRPEYLGAHSGQISFPGGKAEFGENPVQTALREGEEEIGVQATEVHVLGTLSDFFVIPSNFLVTPVVGVLKHAPLFIPDSKEVAKILSGDVDRLLREDAIREKEILAAGLYRMKAPHFEFENEIVWGATAMMLNEFRMVLKSISESPS
ncbi:MAG: CoA pyrophosphatase [Cyclobacteriaceae bacterium]|nr:CoA pyrophosphatase [Cyclobacteriaceae bacterium]